MFLILCSISVFQIYLRVKPLLLSTSCYIRSGSVHAKARERAVMNHPRSPGFCFKQSV